MSGVIARVFPRRTSATPDDELAFVGGPPIWRVPCDEVHVSCTFTWDIRTAEILADQWRLAGYSVKLGGPALGTPSEEFESGRYLQPGLTITSRGCIRRCPNCFVPEREGALRLLPIKPGNDVLDNNLLACPRPHIEAVLAMLDDQPQAARFTGGLDARLLKPWFARRLGNMRLNILFTAYDYPGQEKAVIRAVKLLSDSGLNRRQIGCYVMVGYEGDTPLAAAKRLESAWTWGALPFAMYFRSLDAKTPEIPDPWFDLVRNWTRPAAMFAAHAAATLHDESDCLFVGRR